MQYVDDGAKIFEIACKLGLEGIVCKTLDALYKSGHFADGSK